MCLQCSGCVCCTVVVQHFVDHLTTSVRHARNNLQRPRQRPARLAPLRYTRYTFVLHPLHLAKCLSASHHFVQYIVSTPFSTEFKYTRFNAVGLIAARNVSLLNGLKALTSSALEESAGSAELHAAPADTPIAR